MYKYIYYIGPNAPTERDIQDEEVHRAIERLFDLERQTRDLEEYKDWQVDNFSRSLLPRYWVSFDTYKDWQVDNFISSSEEDEDFDAVLDVGQVCLHIRSLLPPH